MRDLDWIELAWKLYCPRAAKFWRFGLRDYDQEPLGRECQWHEDEEEDSDQAPDRAEPQIMPEEDRGDPVFRILQHPPLFVWIGAMFCFLRWAGIEMGLVKAGSREIVVQCKPSSPQEEGEVKRQERASLNRCGKCPYAFLCRDET